MKENYEWEPKTSSVKNILLLAPTFYFLYKQIVCELEKQGFKVTFISDELQGFNPYFSTSPASALKKIYYSIYKPNLKYLRKYHDEINCKYDYFICINGYSFHPFLLNQLHAINPQIKTILYLWDGLSFFDFSHTFTYFDSVFSFDIIDSQKAGIKYLPLYWVNSNVENSLFKWIYDITFIGTLHSDRFRLINKIVCQCNSFDIKHFIKLVYRQRDLSNLDKLKYFYYKNKNDFNAMGFVDEYNILNGKVHTDFICDKPFSENEVKNIMQNSRCIMDIQLPYQSGLTNRMITSMAMGKKVITTNQIIRNTPFWDPNNIFCIDRIKPCLKKEFIYSNYIPNSAVTEYLESLRIDRWIKTLLYD